MTDAELNRAVAEARGYTIYHYDKDYAEQCYYALTAPDGSAVGDHHRIEAWAWAEAPNVCTDPAAWGALFTELKARGFIAAISAHYMDDLYTAVLRREYGGITWEADDPAPGRALALAFLKAVQP